MAHSPAFHAEVRARHEQGQSIAQIASDMGCTYRAVWDLVRGGPHRRVPQPELRRLAWLVRKGVIP